jgi:hypothetical protein
VTFEIPRTVLALPIGLIDRLRIDEGARGARPLVVRIDIIYMHEETCIRDIRRQRGSEAMFAGYSVKPNRGVTRPNLAMDGLPFRVSLHASAIEPKRIDQEIVGCRDILIRKNGDDSLETWHAVLLLSVRQQTERISEQVLVRPAAL